MLFLAAFAGGGAQGQGIVLEVIPLKHRTAEQVIPLLQPLVGAEGSIGGFQNQLVIRTTPANLDEIRRVLASVDTLPRRLLITVRQDGDIDVRGRSAAVSGTVGGDHGRVTVPGSLDPGGGSVVVHDGASRIRAQAGVTQSSESDRTSQTVQVLEGNSAFIRVGQSLPVPNRQVVRRMVGGRVVEQVVQSVEYRDVTTGFHVRPRLSGDVATLEISPQHETMSREVPGAVNTQHVATMVSGRLGEWIEISGVGQERTEQRSVLLGSTSRASAATRRVLLKVEELR